MNFVNATTKSLVAQPVMVWPVMYEAHIEAHQRKVAAKTMGDLQPCYVAFTGSQFWIALDGAPICEPQPTLADALAYAWNGKANVGTFAWNGDRCEWVHLHTLPEMNAMVAAQEAGKKHRAKAANPNIA